MLAISHPSLYNIPLFASTGHKDTDKVYCYAVKRNPTVTDKITGAIRQLKRSAYSDNKTRLIRGPLYHKLGKDQTISFCYSDDPEKELSDEQIISNWTKRKLEMGIWLHLHPMFT